MPAPALDCESLEEEFSFKYLGATLSKDGTCNVYGSPQPQQRWSDWKGYIRATSAFRASSSPINRWSQPPFSIAVWLEQSWLSQEKANRCSRTNAWENTPASSTGNNVYVRSNVKSLVGSQNSLAATIKPQKMSWFGWQLGWLFLRRHREDVAEIVLTIIVLTKKVIWVKWTSQEPYQTTLTKRISWVKSSFRQKLTAQRTLFLYNTAVPSSIHDRVPDASDAKRKAYAR